MKNGSIVAIIMGVLLILSGFVCIFHPVMTLATIPWLIGLDMIFDGVGEICTYSARKANGQAGTANLVMAVLSLVFGIALFTSFALQIIVGKTIVYLVAAWILLMGIIRIVSAFKLKKAPVEGLANHWGVVLAMGILLTVCGIASFIMPLVLASVIGINLGVIVIIAGFNLVTVGSARPA